jgi:hypothetical protein
MYRSATTFIGFSLLTAIAAVGCGGNKEEPQSAYNQQQQYPQQGGYQQNPQQGGYQQNPQQGGYQQNPQQGGYPQQNPQQGGYPQQNPQQGGYPQQGQTTAPQTGVPATGAPQSASAQPVDASMAAPVQGAIQQLGRTQAPPGAKALGSLIVANFAQGQSFEQSIQLQANKCYTIVAAGAPGVNEVNIKLMPPMIPTTIAQDNTTGPQATLGQNPTCWKNGPIPAPMRVVFEVPSGQGIVAAQIYEK